MKLLSILMAILSVAVLSGCAALGFGARMALLEDAVVMTARGQVVRGLAAEAGFTTRAALGTLEISSLSRTITPATLSSIRATVTAEEMALIEGTVANRPAFNQLFQRVWLDKANTLYIRNAAGQPLHFAEMVDHDLVKLFSNQRYYKLPGSMFKVKGTSRIRVKTGPFESANFYKYIDPERPILVLEKLPSGWSEIMIGETTGLFVLTALLEPCTFASDSTTQVQSDFRITSPQDRAEFDYPRTTSVAWTAMPGATSYVLQVELADRPYDYTATSYGPLPYSPYGLYRTTYRSATFDGMGKQVHRFRVIAKDGQNFLAVTPWRYVNYIN